tara:strand:+ start:2195 stop:3628 length:1434 start_codon:yes stop_codon:yes gene_type:complete
LGCICIRFAQGLFPSEENGSLEIRIVVRKLTLLLPILFFSCNQNPVDEVVMSEVERENEDLGQLVTIVDGYMDRISYHAGETAYVYVNASEKVENGIVKLFSVNGVAIDSIKTSAKPQTMTGSAPWANGYGYELTFEYEIPDLPSGVYEWEGNITFIVKSNQNEVDAVVVYPSNTLNAYTTSGGKSLYKPEGEQAVMVSFQRPMNASDDYHRAFFEWLSDQSQYHIGYLCDMDVDDYSELERSRLLVITGHSEYWTRKARENFDRFVDSGNDAIVLSGNTMWWQVRYNDERNQLICYKEESDDPTSDSELKTIRWADSQLNYSIVNSIGADFDHGGYGNREDDGWDGYRIVAEESPLLEGLALERGDLIVLPTNEYDGAPVMSFDESGFPVLSQDSKGSHRTGLIGFDLTVNRYGREGVGTFIVFQEAETSGIVINAASMNWCGEAGIAGQDGDKIQRITLNMFDKLLVGSELFGGN